LTFVSLAAGKYKDAGNPDTPLSPEEKALFQRDLNITMQNFIDDVAQNRNLSVASVTAIANGSSMLGKMALQDGLIDKIGNIYDVEDYLKGKIGDDVTLCE
jgi:protease-4